MLQAKSNVCVSKACVESSTTAWHLLHSRVGDVGEGSGREGAEGLGLSRWDGGGGDDLTRSTMLCF